MLRAPLPPTRRSTSRTRDAAVAAHLERLVDLCPSQFGAPTALDEPKLWDGAVRQLRALGSASTAEAALGAILGGWDALLGALGCSRGRRPPTTSCR